MKLQHVGLASALAAGAAAQHDDGRHFINWDVIEHPVVESFKWTRPFPDDHTSPMGFESRCNVLHQFHAKQFKYREFHGPELQRWGDLLTDFYTRKPYPGHWDGVNEGGDNRDLMMMEWKDVPKAVQHWIEEQMLTGKADDNRWSWLIAAKHPAKGEDKVTQTVGPSAEPTMSPGENLDGHKREMVPKLKDKEKVLFFVAGAMYDILPLWVAKYSKCESTLRPPSPPSPLSGHLPWVPWYTIPYL